MSVMGMEPTRGACRYCAAEFEIRYHHAPVTTGECTRCYLDRSRGREYVARMARSATRRAKAYKATGDITAAKDAAKEARRLVSIAKAL